MSQMKTITPEQAQQWCNENGVIIAVNGDTESNSSPIVVWYECEPVCDAENLCWNSTDGDAGFAPFRIASSRPWTEQIWRPEV